VFSRLPVIQFNPVITAARAAPGQWAVMPPQTAFNAHIAIQHSFRIKTVNAGSRTGTGTKADYAKR
jgi:hypothetical protein